MGAFCEYFGKGSRKRKELLEKIGVTIKILQEIGYKELYLDGNFVTKKTPTLIHHHFSM